MPVILPKKYRSSHTFAVSLHDRLVHILKTGEDAGLLYSEHPFSPEEAATEGLDGPGFWEWCKANGRRDLLEEYTFRRAVFALIADFCHFTLEGLRNSAKGKLSVAFTLFRKPLQDNLFFLEWMLADRADFFAHFRQGAAGLDFSKMDTTMKKSRRLDVISKAIEKVEYAGFFSPEDLYEVRYEKANVGGLDPLFNQAIHLVTRTKGYETPPEDLNFVFLTLAHEDEYHALWTHLYCTLPRVLFYAKQIVKALFAMIDPRFPVVELFDEFRDFVGQLLVLREWGDNEQRREAMSAIRSFFEGCDPFCATCNEQYGLGVRNLRWFVRTGKVRCPKCKQLFPLFDPEKV